MIVQARGRKGGINGSAEEKKGLVEDSDAEGEDFELEEGVKVEKDTVFSIQSKKNTSYAWASVGWGYFMNNLAKIILVFFTILSVVILLLVRNRGEEAALICIEEVSKELEVVPYPKVDFKLVKQAKDYTRFSAVNAEQWIIVSVSGPPTPEVEAFTKLKGWQVLAIAISDAPAEWRLANAIFLSLDQQAQLGYRINRFLPYNSYIRKNIGYLFAIQHGAKKIYDADEKASLLHDDLSKVFDLQLSGAGSRREAVLQYRYFDNRKIVNPFIHFGQRSVWPRGLPLESVSEISPEIWYAEVNGGRQYIQQSLANGLPDVDSIFYYTRKSQAVAFDIQFDSFAPPVTLPQGYMAPVNALNTLFHPSAFWALLLPVSVGSKTADIVRGYWGQRLLWEVGGMLGVYPPTIRRKDTLEPILFEQEKDLHAKVDKLVSFLLRWRSNKSTLFEKILHLSHSMTEEGMWTIQDLHLTTAWVQDLVSVGYNEPRVLSHELERNRSSWSNLGHQQFLPHTFSAPYLGVEDLSGMASSMADLTRWRHFWGNIVLILECVGPSDHTVFGWRMFYARLFKHVVILGPEENLDLGVEKVTWQSYNSFAGIFDRYPNADGFLMIKDDVVLNYWNLLNADKKKLWNVHKVPVAWQSIGFNDTGKEWFHSDVTKQNVQKAIKSMPPKFRQSYRKVKDDGHFVMSPSDLYYVPQSYVNDFITLITPANNAQLRPEVAIPLIFQAMEKPDNYDHAALSSMLYFDERKKFDPAALYRTDLDAVHPWRPNNEAELARLFKSVGKVDAHLLDAFD
ncbi:hypothetical protein MPTK1_3g13670 [Marchantia polymorpha subsp. ruderalis]|uniref:Uncharacterized protein n=2 Tax=Marchantia polymorpha TaxID=3197 RepID=A0AAF6B0H0_MARPO|nr:hypothetical protein MARPO_0004s0304 [Marchantia polymorpha]BBN05504.1 hypothetical protein Mp_3g13670 [Marchantia polymorpha subsp. ruderalis]|eukprot:PTQ49081.1 hypothetical protein MARPO_0004s0304 [Marchantia polymorpha]